MSFLQSISQNKYDMATEIDDMATEIDDMSYDMDNCI